MENKKQATIRLKNLAIGYKAKNNTKVVASGLCTEINSGELTCLPTRSVLSTLRKR
jgi:iron complex transport system ATP-binding protein